MPLIKPEVISSCDFYAEKFRRRNFSFIVESQRGTHHKQRQALQILTDNTTVEFTYGGAAGGAKSWTGCTWLLFMCKNYPGTKWFIGREELKRLKDSTFLTFYKAAKYYGFVAQRDFIYNGQDHFLEFENGSRIDLLDLKYLPSDPLYERYGSTEYTGGWIEEGGEVYFDAFDTLRSRINRCKNDEYGLMRKIFVTCNPKKNWLYQYFWKPFKEGKLLPYQKFLQSFVDDNPFGESGYRATLESIKDPIKRLRLLKGEWEYDDDPSQLCDYDAINDCFTNEHVAPGERYISGDIARFGDDQTVLIVWNGWRAERIITLTKSGIDEIADEVKDLMKDYHIPARNVVVDEDGVGGGLKDVVKCRGFVNNSKPIEIKGETENYSNLKSQCSFRLASRINKNGVFINCRTERIREMIVEELEQLKKKDPDSEKKLSILPKEEVKKAIGRSPDYSDALVMRESFELTPKLTSKFAY